MPWRCGPVVEVRQRGPPAVAAVTERGVRSGCCTAIPLRCVLRHVSLLILGHGLSEVKLTIPIRSIRQTYEVDDASLRSGIDSSNDRTEHKWRRQQAPGVAIGLGWSYWA